VKYGFNKIRFALFTKSYGGNLIAEYIKKLPSDKRRSSIIKLSKVLLFNKQFLNCFILHKTCKSKFSKVITGVVKKDERVKIYLLTENELSILVKEKKSRDNIVPEDYEYALLEPAFERVAGNSLRKINSDLEFDRKIIGLISMYKRYYYQVAYRYRVPTLRIIPFILRLITI
jgi:hypothetical protein